ncbi:MAG: N-acetylglucosamine-6-phosphate deacetylase [Eubacteriales bacterium]
MKKALINATILKNGKKYNDYNIVFDKNILKIGNDIDLQDIDEVISVNGAYVSAGFIDLHIHGFAGFDFMEETDKALEGVSRLLPSYGVTSFLPTTLTAPIEEIERVISSVRMYGSNYSEPIGIHMEGPLINKDKAGAQNKKYIKSLQEDWIIKNQDIIKIITLAPEANNGIVLVNNLKRNSDIVLSIGHSNASYEEAVEVFDKGVSYCTHLFNAMTSFHHRKPGLSLAALMKPCYVEIIADNKHLHPSIYNMVYKLKGVDSVILISDCVLAGGLEDGYYLLKELKIRKEKELISMEDGTIAGSVLTLNKAIKNVKESTNLLIEEIILAVTENPAKAIGLEDRGSIALGKKADLVVFDDNIDIKYTIKNGEIVYKNKGAE